MVAASTAAALEMSAAAVPNNSDTKDTMAAAIGPTSTQSQQEQAKPKQKRLYFIDWLRTVLTVFVVVHHVWSSYRPTGGDTYWFVQKAHEDDWVVNTVVDWLVSTPSMPYAMCLFFLLAGYFTPGSFNRKGPLKHVGDRLIRLLIPVVVYAVLINPLILTINKAAGIPADSPSPLAFLRNMTYAEVWRWWYSNFNIAPGPTWFVWCLFWFDVGYVLVCMVHKALQKPLERLAARRVAASAARSGSPNGSTVNEAEESGHVAIAVANSSQASSSNANPSGSQEYSVTTTLIGMAVLTLAFTVVSFAALMATYTSDKAAGYDGFWAPSAFVLFRPSWLGPNAISFILGCQAMKLNLLRKLPARMTYWCLIAAALWWPFGYMMPSYIDTPYRPEPLWGTYPISGGMVGYIFYMKFASWSFAVVWGLGVLLLFRELFNDAPGKVGRQLIAGAYGAYIIHPLFIALWGWAFMGVRFYTFAGSAILASPFVVASSWAFTALVRCIPGTTRVLG